MALSIKRCTKCQQEVPEDQIKKSWCKDCKREYERNWKRKKYQNNKEWREKERLRRKRYRTTYEKKARLNESSPRRFLRGKWENIRKTVKKYGHDLAIDLDFLCCLWEEQRGICALTGLQMTTKFHCPYSVSPDRIDSGKGYIPDNVQLVCKAINLAKNNLDNERIIRWIEDLRKI